MVNLNSNLYVACKLDQREGTESHEMRVGGRDYQDGATKFFLK